MHNVNTWRMQDWVGFGPSAASQYCRQRWTNAASLQGWAKGEKRDSYFLTDKILAADSLIFGLRMNEGVQLSGLIKQFSSIQWEKFNPLVEKLLASHYATFDNHILKLTDDGRMVADAIAGEIFNHPIFEVQNVVSGSQERGSWS